MSKSRCSAGAAYREALAFHIERMTIGGVDGFGGTAGIYNRHVAQAVDRVYLHGGDRFFL